MAENLARIYGTEEDKINCPFYFKIGACRHGDRCSRNHNRPHFSQTLLIPHMYQLPPMDPMTGQPQVNEKEHLTDFCEEVIDELQNYGLLEEFHVVGNLGEHMLGNVYLKYSSEEEAEKCLKALNGRFYGGRQLTCEYSPVTDFRESRCRQYDEETCNRGGFCNFHHMRPLPSVIRKELERIKERGKRRHRHRSRSGSRERSDRHRERSHERSSRDHGSSRDRDRDRDHHRSSRDRSDRDSRRDSERSSRHREHERSSSTAEPAPSSSSSSSSMPPPSTSSDPSRPARSPSEERRAKIAAWNAARDAKKAAEGQ